SGRAVRSTRSWSERSVTSLLVTDGKTCSALLGMATDWATSTAESGSQGPVRQVAPSVFTNRSPAPVADAAARPSSGRTTFARWSAPVSSIDLWISLAARSDAFLADGPREARPPVSGIASPIVRLSVFSPGPDPAPPPPQAATPSAMARPADNARVFVLCREFRGSYFYRYGREG